MSQRPLAITYCGQVANKNYIAHIAFNGAWAERAKNRATTWRLALGGRKALRADELVIFETNPHSRRLLRGRYQLDIPTWVGGTLELDHVMQRLRRSRNAKKDMSRFARAGVSYEIRKDRQAFDDFYHRMYKPYMTAVYGDRAFVMGYHDMVRRIDHCELLLIKRRDEYVSGAILVYENGMVKGWSVGVKEGDRQYVKTGALKAIDYFQAIYLHQKGFRTLHLGGSRPFLNDGVLRKKRAEGMQITDDSPLRFGLMFSPKSESFAAFLASNPLICRRDGSYWSTVVVDQDAPLSVQRFHELYDEYYVAGAAGLWILTGKNTPEPAAVPTELAGRVSVTRLAAAAF